MDGSVISDLESAPTTGAITMYWMSGIRQYEFCIGQDL